jgi:4a-hydroxytetrahydrobiopterin dehydratase
VAEQITAGQFHAADGIEDWRSVYHLVSAHFRTGSLGEGVALVDAIGELVGVGEQEYVC